MSYGSGEKLRYPTMTTVWNRFFKKPPGKNLILEMLPEEILVDGIIGCLHVKDILRLRQLNKAFALLTKKPAVWKRFLPLVKKLPQPLAPLPPICHYNFRNLSSMDIEHIVTKAISLDDNLRGDTVAPWRYHEFPAFGEVSDMVLLPGGHFSITSVKYQYGPCGIMLWAVKHPASGLPAPIFYRETEVKAYALQAKYMTVRGKKGICVSFLRKRHKKRGDKRDIPENAEMGGKEDPEDPWMPLKYECTTIHISMHSIEMLTNRRIPPQTPEFTKLCSEAMVDPDGRDSVFVVSRIRTGAQLGVINLDVIGGLPFVTVVKRPDQIVLECLDDGVRSILHCLPHPGWPDQVHSIWNFRILPDQGHIVAFRFIEEDCYTIDLFRIPGADEKLLATPISTAWVKEREILNVQFSPSKAPTIADEEDPSITPYLFENKMPPPPLSIYLRTRFGVEHHTLWPIFNPFPPSPPESPDGLANGRARNANRRPGVYLYDLEEHWIIKLHGPRFGIRGNLRVLPGVFNAFTYEIPVGYRSTTPPIRSLWSYIYKGGDHSRPLAQPEEVEVEGMLIPVEANGKARKRAPQSNPLFFERKSLQSRKQLAPLILPENCAAAVRKGVGAICWDEDTGRVIVATTDRCLRLLDFAYSRDSDDLDDILGKEMDIALEEEERRFAFATQHAQSI